MRLTSAFKTCSCSALCGKNGFVELGDLCAGFGIFTKLLNLSVIL